MRLKIRCDEESEKFCKIFWKLNKALYIWWVTEWGSGGRPDRYGGIHREESMHDACESETSCMQKSAAVGSECQECSSRNNRKLAVLTTPNHHMALVPLKKNFVLSHQIFRHVYKALNINYKIINYTIYMYFTRWIF